MLAAKRDYWLAVDKLNPTAMSNAVSAMQRASMNGATLTSNLHTGLDMANRDIMNNKFQWWTDYREALPKTAKQQALEAQTSEIRQKAVAAGISNFVVPNDSGLNVDDKLKNLYQAKKEKWKAIETLGSANATDSVRKKANGGTNGLDHRINVYNKIKEVLN